MRILAVDDDPLALDILRIALENAGYSDCAFVNSGAEALDLLRSLDHDQHVDGGGFFDYFLLDIQMPKMTGIQLCERLRRLECYRRTPIIMITSMKERDFIRRAFEAGATDYVTKPYDPVELTARIRVAEMLVTEQRKGLEAYFVARSVDKSGSPESLSGFEIPFEVKGVKSTLSFQALENYYLSLSRRKAFDSLVIAATVVEAKEVFKSSSPEEFANYLKLIARGIHDVVKDGDFLVAYFGSGFFVGVSSRGSPLFKSDLEAELNKAVKKRFAKQDLEATIVLGQPQRANAWQRNDFSGVALSAVASCAERAMDPQEKRSVLKRYSPATYRYRVHSED